jgi:hypothetical protein
LIRGGALARESAIASQDTICCGGQQSMAR